MYKIYLNTATKTQVTSDNKSIYPIDILTLKYKDGTYVEIHFLDKNGQAVTFVDISGLDLSISLSDGTPLTYHDYNWKYTDYMIIRIFSNTVNLQKAIAGKQRLKATGLISTYDTTGKSQNHYQFPVIILNSIDTKPTRTT